MKRKILPFLILCTAALTLTGCDSSDYKNAMSLYESGNYEEAASVFEELGDYEDSATMVLKCDYSNAVALLEAEDYESAAAIFQKLGDYEDAKSKLKSAKHELMMQNYGDVIEALKGETWYFNGGSETVLNCLEFSDRAATITQLYFDGNGKQNNGVTSYVYGMDDENIIITMKDGSEKKIPYEFSNGSVKPGSNDYYNESQIKSGLLGYWKCKTETRIPIFNTVVVSEDNIYITENTLKLENATLNDETTGRYYYYGPYTGTYTLNKGGFDTDMMHGNEWFFNIVNGEVVLFNYDNPCTRSDSLPGPYGYSF